MIDGLADMLNNNKMSDCYFAGFTENLMNL
jgi:hypothetical protein